MMTKFAKFVNVLMFIFMGILISYLTNAFIELTVNPFVWEHGKFAAVLVVGVILGLLSFVWKNIYNE